MSKKWTDAVDSIVIGLVIIAIIIAATILLIRATENHNDQRLEEIRNNITDVLSGICSYSARGNDVILTCQFKGLE